MRRTGGWGFAGGASGSISGYNLGCAAPRSKQRALHSTISPTLEDDPFPSLLSVALVLAGAWFGGLHAVFASPLRACWFQSLSPRWRERAESLSDHADGVRRVALLLRTSLVTAAALVVAPTLTTEEGQFRWVALGLLIALSLLSLEGFPLLLRRGKGLPIALAIAPLARLFVRRADDSPQSPVEPDRAHIQRAEQLLVLASEHELPQRLGGSELKMIGRLLELPELDAADVMTPRTAITAVSAETSVADALQTAALEGHSRLPVYDSDLDHVLGVFHIKDALGSLESEALSADQQKVRHAMRPVVNVPETVKLPALLEQMQAERVHLVVVVDEYGGTAGVVSIEDLLEQIVGDIQDEHDTIEDQPQIHSVDEGEVVADGAVSILELNEEHGFDLPEDESYETVAGLLFDRLGRIPAQGERLELPQVAIEVMDADDRRVRVVRLQRLSPIVQQESDAA